MAGEEGSVFVLSRTNAELLRIALEMWRRKIPFNLAQSTELLQPIKGVLAKLLKGDVPAPKPASGIVHIVTLMQIGEDQAGISRTLVMGKVEKPSAPIEKFKQQLGAWYMTEMMKAQNAGSVSWAERIEEQFRTILYCLNYVTDPREIEALLENIYLYDETCWITLSTVHKAKGLEADRTYLLRETFQRHQDRRDREGNRLPCSVEEINVEYVAITRARRSLTWVSLGK
jgi:hypothetical protein